jgi:hypothetical protein
VFFSHQKFDERNQFEDEKNGVDFSSILLWMNETLQHAHGYGIFFFFLSVIRESYSGILFTRPYHLKATDYSYRISMYRLKKNNCGKALPYNYI